ncbi:YitT family protein [uncultured Anaerococcus sp.]|jgi:hypothetical membrane spanning protein|uniref:YczE/YyaS/YitT family protein n=1 Tax=uncultured Anaerococcus sp. TaxID=293428 RepID=UPI0026342E7F|nr:hypothetical protein [uncultured Anaerococcus sp.]
MKSWNLNYLKRVLICIFATILIGISIGMMKLIDLGTDPFTSLIIGISNLTNTPFRIIYPSINAIILILIFIFNRPMVGAGTLINLLIIGPVADYTAAFIDGLYPHQTLLSKLIILLIALIIMAMNVSLYTSTKVGVSAYDSLFLTINKKNPKISLGLARIITDSLSMIVGFLGRATLGIGTLINVFLMGPMVEFFNKNVTNKLLKNII